MNPITGAKGEEVSSETIKNCWINLVKMQKENDTSMTKLKKMKQDHYVEQIVDYIDDIQEELHNINDSRMNRVHGKTATK